MEKLEKWAALTTLMRKLRQNGSWCGETHVQKATYLAQELLGVPFGFTFILYKHGPFSFDLSDELMAMRADEVVVLKPHANRYGPTLLPGPAADRIESNRRRAISGLGAPLEFVADTFGARGVAELERLSTAFMVTRETIEGATVEERADLLTGLKPHVSRSEAIAALKEVDGLMARARPIMLKPLELGAE